MQINGAASAVIVVWFVLSSLVLVALLALVALTLIKLQARLDTVTERVEPLLLKTDALLTAADERLRTVGAKAETLLTTGETLAVTVQERVEQTSGAVQRTVNAPLIQANAVASGFTRAWQTWGSLSKTAKKRAEKNSAADGTIETVEPVKQRVRVYGEQR